MASNFSLPAQKGALLKPVPIMTANCSMTRATGSIIEQHRQSSASRHHPDGPFFFYSFLQAQFPKTSLPLGHAASVRTHIATSSNNNEAARCAVTPYCTRHRPDGRTADSQCFCWLSWAAEPKRPTLSPAQSSAFTICRFMAGLRRTDWLTVLCHVTSSSSVQSTAKTAAYILFFFFFFPTYMGGEPVGRSLCPFPTAGWRGNIKRKARRHLTRFGVAQRPRTVPCVLCNTGRMGVLR